MFSKNNKLLQLYLVKQGRCLKFCGTTHKSFYTFFEVALFLPFVVSKKFDGMDIFRNYSILFSCCIQFNLMVVDGSEQYI